MPSFTTHRIITLENCIWSREAARAQDFPSLEIQLWKKCAPATWAEKRSNSHLKTTNLLVILCVAQWAEREQARRWKERKNKSERGRMAEVSYLCFTQKWGPGSTLSSSWPPAKWRPCKWCVRLCLFLSFYCWKTNKHTWVIQRRSRCGSVAVTQIADD